MKTLTWKGTKRTLAEWSQLTGISTGTLYYRMKAGYSVREVLDPGSGRRRLLAALARGSAAKARPLTFRGETLTMSEWARRTGIARRTIRERLRAGWTIKKALMTSVTKKSGNRWSRARSAG